MYSVGIITVSDKGAAGQRTDASGPAIRELVEEQGYSVERMTIVPDEEDLIFKELLNMADQGKLHLILTTGGTGFSRRDVTPEATQRAIQRKSPGISEAIRAHSMTITPRAMLSRGVSGIRNQSLIINLPGSPKAVKESLSFILPGLQHGLAILAGDASECAGDSLN